MEPQKLFNSTVLNQQLTKDIQKNDNALGDLMQKDLRNFTWADVGKLILLVPTFLTSLVMTITKDRPPQLVAPIRQSANQRQTVMFEKQESYLISCGEPRSLKFAESEDEIRARVGFQRCVLESTAQRSTNRPRTTE